MKKKNYFVSVDEALKKIGQAVKPLAKSRCDLHEALGCVLSKDIKSPIQSPPFHQSAMDGYAFRFADLKKGKDLEIVDEVAAGGSFRRNLKPGQVVRIFTGAMIPQGADTVVMQERVITERKALVIKDPLLKKGANIRTAGSQVKKRKIALKKGTVLTPAGLGYLASLGITNVEVYRKPKVAVVITGDELVEPGKKLAAGAIYESNAITLEKALREQQIDDIKVFRVKDNLATTRRVFTKALKESDLILFSGGISVGEYDFVGKLMHEQKVNTLFYKVRQKPGKPLYFGKTKSTCIFGLPGNPASALTCYYIYVLKAVNRMKGMKNDMLPALDLKLSLPLWKKPGLSVFLKGHTDYRSVTPLDGQESYIMKSFAEANCLIQLNEDDTGLKAGDQVRVWCLPAF
jgi:molybdopterin molybdotransferase